MRRMWKLAFLGLMGLAVFVLPGGDCEVDLDGFAPYIYYPYDDDDVVYVDDYYYDPYPCCYYY